VKLAYFLAVWRSREVSCRVYWDSSYSLERRHRKLRCEARRAEPKAPQA
jgi:hypothetical protein